MQKAKKSKKTIYILGGIVLLLILIIIIGKSTGTIGKKDGIKVAVAKTEKRNITEIVTGNGKIQPEIEVKISSDVSGEITELYVKEGDSVKAGQLLARIDPELYQSALDRTDAALNNSKANLASSRARLLQSEAKMSEIENQFKRNQRMHDEKLMSDAEFETARSAYLTAKADVEASKQTILASQFTVQSQEASLKEARKNLTRTEIFAPVNGIVSKLSVEKGERVVGTSQMTGTEMMRVANLNDMEVSVDVNENDIVKVGLGDTAVVEVDAYGTRKFKGIVTEVANSATTTTQTTSDQVTNFVVKIRILRSSYADLSAKYGTTRSVFRPGMSASVEIQTETAMQVLVVPIEAVTMRSRSDLDTTGGAKPSRRKSAATGDNKTPQGADDIEVVFLSKDNTVMLKEVKTGIQDDKYIQIVSGLNEKDEVVAAPYSAISKTLRNGDKIEKVDKSSLFEAKPGS